MVEVLFLVCRENEIIRCFLDRYLSYFTYEKYASTDIYGTKYTKSSQDFKIRFMNDGSFEIMLIYPNSTNIIRVKPITYTIEYLPE